MRLKRLAAAAGFVFFAVQGVGNAAAGPRLIAVDEHDRAATAICEAYGKSQGLEDDALEDQISECMVGTAAGADVSVKATGMKIITTECYLQAEGTTALVACFREFARLNQGDVGQAASEAADNMEKAARNPQPRYVMPG